MDMSSQDLLQVARLLYPANVMAVNSGSSQALAEVNKLMLTHAKYAEWETVKTNAILRAHSLEAADQKRIISQIVMAIRDGHTKGSTHEAEASRILEQITTAQQTGTFAEFYGAILWNLMSNGVLYRSSLEAGIFTTTASRVRIRVRESNSVTQTKEYGKPEENNNSAGKDGNCSSCGRKGHIAANCNFVKARHPDVNSDFEVAWA